MAYSQSVLGRKFRRGATTGQASNVQIQEAADGGTVLVGYGHAVYAHRSPTGYVTAYAGWKDSDSIRGNAGSVSTKQQFSKMGLISNADTVLEGTGTREAPKVGSFDPTQKKPSA